MGNPEFIPLRRIHREANEQARREFGRRLLAALDEAGVQPDQEFVIGPISLLLDDGRDAAARTRDIMAQARQAKDNGIPALW